MERLFLHLFLTTCFLMVCNCDTWMTSKSVYKPFGPKMCRRLGQFMFIEETLTCIRNSREDTNASKHSTDGKQKICSTPMVDHQYLDSKEHKVFRREKGGKCYKPYGCFNIRKPYNNAGGKAPISPKKQRISFLLYTRKNPTSKQILKDGDLDGVKASNFDPCQNTKIIFHTDSERGRERYIKNMTAELMLKENCNVIAVDWEKGSAKKLGYQQVAANTRVVGAVTAELIKTLFQRGTSLATVHLIGYDLGAHVAGYAGERLPGVGRITGLEPAKRCFENEDKKVRLDPSDAVFVDVIHTDITTWMKTPVGCMDFFPSGGYDQPGCPEKKSSSLFTNILGASSICSHKRAVHYFTASINGPCKFKAYPCSLEDMKACTANSCGTGCSDMGYNATPTVKGTFYVPIKESPPYC